MNTFVNSTLVDILTAVLTCAAAWAIYYINVGTQIAKEKAKAIKDDRQKALLDGAIDRVNDLAQKTVARTEQTTAGELRNAVKDGNIDRSELLALGKKVTDDVYSQLSKDAIDALQAEMGDVKKYVTDTVESEVLKLKTNISPVPITVTAPASNVSNLIMDSAPKEPSVKAPEAETESIQNQSAVQNTTEASTQQTGTESCVTPPIPASAQINGTANITQPINGQTENNQLSPQQALNQIHEIVKNVDLNK